MVEEFGEPAVLDHLLDTLCASERISTCTWNDLAWRYLLGRKPFQVSRMTRFYYADERQITTWLENHGVTYSKKREKI